MADNQPRTTARGVILLLVLLVACQPSLDGTWSGYDEAGDAVSLTFGPSNSLEITTDAGAVSPSLADATLEYEVLDEVYPRQLHAVFAMGDTLRHREPIGIYKIDQGRLVICPVTVTQRTISGFPIGEPSYEWPSEFSGNCYGLDRS